MYSPLFIATPFDQGENVELPSMEEELSYDFNYNKPYSLSKYEKIMYREKLIDANTLYITAKRSNNIHEEGICAIKYGIIACKLFDADEAISKFEHAARLFKKLGDYENYGLSLHYASNIYLLASFKTSSLSLYCNDICKKNEIDSKLVEVSLEKNQNFLNILSNVYETRDNIQYLVSYYNMGIICTTLCNYLKATEHFRDALTICLSLPTNRIYTKIMIMCFNYLGVTYLRCKEYIQAKDSLYDAIPLCKKYQQTEAIICIFINFAAIFTKQGNYDQSIKYLSKAQVLANSENLSNTSKLILVKLKFISSNHRKLGN